MNQQRLRGPRLKPRRVGCLTRASDWLLEEWATVLFVVSLVAVLHAEGPLKPLSRLTLLALANVHAETMPPGQAGSQARTWLVGIEQDDFEQRYQERRPLSRCELKKDLEKLLALKPKVLAVDLDLSPLPRPTPEEHECQLALDDLLDKSPKTYLVLIRPFSPGSKPLGEVKSKWMGLRTRVHFADSTLDYPLNLAIEYVCNADGLAEIAYQASGRVLPCDPGDGVSYPINYRAQRQDVHELAAAELPSLKEELPCTTVFFGNRSGVSDRAITPVGSTHGVVVHAAKFVTFDRALSHPEGMNFLFDLLYAVGFSMFIAWFMGRYLSDLKPDDAVASARFGASLAVFVVIYGFVCVGLVRVAEWLVVNKEIVTEPLLVALGLAFDGFVVAAWSHVGAAPHPEPKSLPSCRDMPSRVKNRIRKWFGGLREVSEKSCAAAAFLALRWLVFWVVVSVAVAHAVPHAVSNA